MAIAITINEKEYTFDLNRENYRKYVLQDPEYSAIQTKLGQLSRSKGAKGANEQEVALSVAEIILENDVTLLKQITMIEQEKIFFASLVKNYPKMSVDKSNQLLDLAIKEYGEEEVAELCKELTANFTQVGETPKKKMVRRVI
jgi:hypothetical protein